MPRRERILLVVCLLFATGVFVTGINWGLPSRAADEFLFGDRTPWTGAEILALAPLDEDPNRGADVDADPLVGRDKVIVLNETDKQRAEIVRRYRLFTYQPDEYNTMKSLSGMNPGRLRLDPRMYQYGGLWVYPVGALLKVASLFGLVHLTMDKAYYLDHPEQFARFYVVARVYSAAWGVVGAWAVYRLARKLTGSMAAAAVACACWAMMPVVVNMAHEAKPHLAGLSLMLCAILAATRYVESGAPRWWVVTGALCGAAFGMVISSLIVFIILPLMTLLRQASWRERVLVTTQACAVGGLVYAITNPYVWINLIWNREVLRSNLGTSTAMYQATLGEGFRNAVKLIAEGTSIGLALIGAFCVFGLVLMFRSPAVARHNGVFFRAATFWLMLAPAAVVLVQFVSLAGGKSAEYGRFALLPDTLLCVAAVAGMWLSAGPPGNLGGAVLRAVCVAVVLAFTGFGGFVYLAHFVADTRMPTTRLLDAEGLRGIQEQFGASRLSLVAEPAPYVMPPVNLWTWRLELQPVKPQPDEAARAYAADVALRAVDERPRVIPEGFQRLAPPVRWLYGWPARISWAAKPFEILVAERPPASAGGGSAGPAATAPSRTPARR